MVLLSSGKLKPGRTPIWIGMKMCHHDDVSVKVSIRKRRRSDKFSSLAATSCSTGDSIFAKIASTLQYISAREVNEIICFIYQSMINIYIHIYIYSPRRLLEPMMVWFSDAVSLLCPSHKKYDPLFNRNIFAFLARWIPLTKASDGALMFSLIGAWPNGWANNRHAGDLRRSRAHYDITIMCQRTWKQIFASMLCIRLCGPCMLSLTHDDVIKLKHFPRDWPFMRGIHRPRRIDRTKASDDGLWCFLWSAPE